MRRGPHDFPFVVLSVAAAIALVSRPGAAAPPLLAPLADASDRYALPDAPAPPTLPDLTHRGFSLALETTVARLQGNLLAPGGETSSTFSSLERLEAEYAVAIRRWYLGAAEELAIGSPPGEGRTRLVASHPEVWGRAVWASSAGLAFGGGLGVVPPLVNHEPGSAADDVARAVRVVRPWDYVVFADRALTLRPFFDVRDIDGALVLQIREGVDWVGPSDGEEARVTSRTALYLGYRIVDLIGVGLEAWEVYFIRAPNIDDHDRAAFALSPSVRVMKGWLQPAISALFPIDRTLLSALDSYFAIRLSFSVVLDANATDRGVAPAPTVAP